MAKINKLLEERDKYKNQDERTYKCCDCHQIMDRDLNASINIMFEGLKLYMNNQLSRV